MAMIVNATTIDAAIGGAEICLHELQSAATTLQTEAPNVGIGQEDISAQAIQKAIDLLNETIQNLNHSSSAYAENKRPDWRDEMGAAYNQTVDNISNLTELPVQTLQRAIPQLQELKQIVQQYDSVSF